MACRAALAAGLLLLAGPGLPAEGEDSAWLIGTWVLDENPDGSPQDRLVFYPDGRSETQAQGGPVWPGGYRLQGSRLHLYFDVEGRLLPLVMSYSRARDRLFIRSERTGNVSSYVRVTPGEAPAR